jgi:hypothetical protein
MFCFQVFVSQGNMWLKVAVAELLYQMQVSFTKPSQSLLEFEQGTGGCKLVVNISPSKVTYPLELKGK